MPCASVSASAAMQRIAFFFLFFSSACVGKRDNAAAEKGVCVYLYGGLHPSLKVVGCGQVAKKKRIVGRIDT